MLHMIVIYFETPFIDNVGSFIGSATCVNDKGNSYDKRKNVRTQKLKIIILTYDLRYLLLDWFSLLHFVEVVKSLFEPFIDFIKIFLRYIIVVDLLFVTNGWVEL